VTRPAPPSAPPRSGAPDGVVRRARRPRGWSAPGPPPGEERGDPELAPGPGEDLCYLLGDWRILQRVDGHRWSLDDLVTAWLACRLAASPRRILDLGTGIASVLMMCAWRFPEATLLGLEAQPISAGLARRSLRYNGLASRAEVRLADLRAPGALGAEDGAFDLVTGTPPYFPPGAGTESGAPQKGPCRFERRGGVEAYCGAARGALHPDGLVVLCHAARQDERLVSAARAADLHLERLVYVAGREGKAPLVAVGAFRARAPGGEAAVETLDVRDRAGQWTPGFRALRRAMGMPDRPPGR